MLKDKIRGLVSHYLDIIYNKFYPPQLLFRNRQRKRLKNKKFCLLAANCIGGYLYHQLGLPFSSPTINLMIYNQDYKKMLLDLKHYMSIKPIPAFDPVYPNIPCGKIDDILIHFTHYSSIEEGIIAWEKRKKRLDFENLYIIVQDIDLSKEEIKDLYKVKCKKLIVLTSHDYGFEHCLYIPKLEGEENAGGTLLKKTFSGKWLFEKFFDFVGWVNSEETKAQNFYIG